MRKQRRLQKLILFLMTLGNSLYSMFVPIYYLNNGVPFYRIIYYLMVFCLGGIVSGIISNLIMHKKGVKIFIVLRGIFEPLIVLAIRYYPIIKYPIELQGFASGLIGFSYWISMDTITLKSTENNNRGKQQGGIYAALWTSTLIAPFIGGFIITRFNYAVLFMLSLFLVLGGGLLSFKLKLEVPVKKRIIWFPRVKGNLSNHMYIVFLRGMTFIVSGFLFPLLLFDLSKQELVVGSFGSFMGIVALISTTISGYLIDKHDKKKILTGFFVLQGISWLLLGILDLPYVLILVVNFFYQAVNVPINTIFFNDIEKRDVVTLISERIIAFCFGAILYISLGLFLDYNALFILLGLITPFSIIFVRKLKI